MRRILGRIYELTINLYSRYRLTGTIPPSTSSSPLGHVPDQNSMRTTLQSYLECLDRHNDKIISVYREMLEIRTRITELLDSIQSEATVMDSGTRDSSAHLQVTFDDEHQKIAPDEPNTMLPLSTMCNLFDLPQPLAQSRFLYQEYSPLESVGVMGSMQEDTDPTICQRPPGKFTMLST